MTISSRCAALSFAAFSIAAGAMASFAAPDPQDELRRRWLGTWLVVEPPLFSNCDTLYTNNEVLGGEALGNEPAAGRLVSAGRYEFPPGELARVTKVDLKRARLDLLLELETPFLVRWNDGPFELVEPRACRAELLFPLVRSAVKAGDLATIESTLAATVRRFDTRERAVALELYNRRETDPLPADYAENYLRYQRWKISAAIEHAGDRIASARLSGRRSNPEYRDGWQEGLRHYFSIPGDCLAAAVATPGYQGGSPPDGLDKGQKADWRRGHNDGAAVAFYTKLLPVLTDCLADLE